MRLSPPGHRGLDTEMGFSSRDKIAAIDIGSNSILLTIAEAGQSLKIIVDEAHVTGLAKGLSKDGLIQPERLSKSLEVIQKYRGLLDQQNVKHIRVAATEATRKAKNGAEVCEKIEKILKLPVELISGDREAELSFWSVQNEYPDAAAKKIVFDIGGASTELALGSKEGIEKRISLKVGSVLLTERFGLDKPADPKPALNYVLDLLRELKWQEPTALGVGVAGTTTCLFAIHLKLKVYDRPSVHLKNISLADTETILKSVTSKNLSERSLMPGLPSDRADVFGGGICIIYALMKYFQWQSFICMDSGVRFGLLYEMSRELDSAVNQNKGL